MMPPLPSALAALPGPPGPLAPLVSASFMVRGPRRSPLSPACQRADAPPVRSPPPPWDRTPPPANQRCCAQASGARRLSTRPLRPSQTLPVTCSAASGSTMTSSIGRPARTTLTNVPGRGRSSRPRSSAKARYNVAWRLCRSTTAETRSTTTLKPRPSCVWAVAGCPMIGSSAAWSCWEICASKRIASLANTCPNGLAKPATWPTCRPLLRTQPSKGSEIVVRARSSFAFRTATSARSTCACARAICGMRATKGGHFDAGLLTAESRLLHFRFRVLLLQPRLRFPQPRLGRIETDFVVLAVDPHQRLAGRERAAVAQGRRNVDHLAGHLTAQGDATHHRHHAGCRHFAGGAGGDRTDHADSGPRRRGRCPAILKGHSGRRPSEVNGDDYNNKNDRQLHGAGNVKAGLPFSPDWLRIVLFRHSNPPAPPRRGRV